MTTKSYLDQLQEQSNEFRAQMIVADLSMELAEVIKEIRTAKGLSQKELAKLIETQQSRVSKMESAADAHFTLLTLAKLADALGCKLKVSLTTECGEKVMPYSVKRARSSANNSMLSQMKDQANEIAC